MNSPIVLIHGLWLTPRSWEGWTARFEQRGHEVLAPAWPGMGFANFNPHAVTKVDFHKDDRPPLLIIGNEKDHTVPASVSREAAKLLGKSKAALDWAYRHVGVRVEKVEPPSA